jgi:hypothetical protein
MTGAAIDFEAALLAPANGLSPYRHFSAAEWAALRNDTTLSFRKKIWRCCAVVASACRSTKFA